MARSLNNHRVERQQPKPADFSKCGDRRDVRTLASQLNLTIISSIVLFKNPIMIAFLSRLRSLPLLPVLLIALLSGCASTDKTPVNIMPPTSSQGNTQAVNDALQLQGQPYVYGGESPREGFDCSGLVVYVYNRQGLKLPRDTRSLAQQLPMVYPEQRQPGDLLFFNTSGKPFSHVGIYVGGDQFVHAPSVRTGRVMLSSLTQSYWRERFVAVRRPARQALSFNANSDSCGFN